jgi:phosphatidylserine/phosphatidylglycerophosphate/cardiolipin synthase-like enzyme
MIRNFWTEGVRSFCSGGHIRTLALTIWLVLLGVARLTAGEKARLPTLPPTVRWTNSTPIAFVKDARIRLYFTNEGFAFDAKWKTSRVAAQTLNYASTTVKCDESPPALPSPASDWRPVRTVAAVECARLLRSAATRLAPTNSGHGLYAQLSAGDVVLFRDAAGEVKWVRFEEKLADVAIDKRYSRQEIASALVQAVEADLRAAYPNEARFVAILSLGLPHLLYLDLERRQSVVLFVPRSGYDPNRPKLGGNIKTLTSFAVVDNGWSFLKNPVSSATRTIHQMLQWTLTLLQPALRSRGSVVPPITNAPSMDLVAWEKWLDQHTGMPRERGAIRLLINGESFFPHFERRLAEAKSNINVQVCIFDRDDVAVQVADLLKARSSNVAAKVIFDRLNSRSAGETPPATPMPANFVAPSSITSYLRSGSRVQVHPQLNPGFTCDHSKVFLIDERYAYMDGMNFGREYRYEWHDLMVEVEGPVVASMQRQFDKKWAQTSVWGDCGLALAAMRSKPASPSTEPPDSMELRRLYTKTFDRQIRSAQLAAIDRAQNHIFLENAYLYSNDMIVALVRARLRGVDVRVIMPGENDFDSGHSSNLVTADYLRQHGVRVYFFPGMSHVKAMLVDGWVCFGSANCDALSLRLNRENNLATSDPAFAATFRREVFDADMARAPELTSKVAVSFGDHLSDLLLNPL